MARKRIFSQRSTSFSELFSGLGSRTVFVVRGPGISLNAPASGWNMLQRKLNAAELGLHIAFNNWSYTLFSIIWTIHRF